MLLCVVAFVILCLATLVSIVPVCVEQTEEKTQGHSKYRASKALSG